MSDVNPMPSDMRSADKAEVAPLDIVVVAPFLELLLDYFKRRAATNGTRLEQEIVGAIAFYLQSQRVLIEMDRAAQGFDLDDEPEGTTWRTERDR